MKDSNPKDLIGSDKLPLHLWPQVASAYGCLGLLDGMLKYGRSNFRAVGVRASIYYDALMRHMTAWFEGQDNDSDSGLPHLAHALACLAILVDAQSSGKLTDDRMYPGGWTKAVKELTPHIKRLKALRSGLNPKHYTLDDIRIDETNSELNSDISWGICTACNGHKYIDTVPCDKCGGYGLMGSYKE